MVSDRGLKASDAAPAGESDEPRARPRLARPRARSRMVGGLSPS